MDTCFVCNEQFTPGKTKKSKTQYVVHVISTKTYLLPNGIRYCIHIDCLNKFFNSFSNDHDEIHIGEYKVMVIYCCYMDGSRATKIDYLKKLPKYTQECADNLFVEMVRSQTNSLRLGTNKFEADYEERNQQYLKIFADIKNTFTFKGHRPSKSLTPDLPLFYPCL